MHGHRHDALRIADRPLVMMAAAFATGIGATYAAGTPLWVALTALACTVAVIAARRSVPHPHLAIATLAMGAMGAFRASCSQVCDGARLPPAGSYVDAIVTVVSLPSQHGTSYTCEVLVDSAAGPAVPPGIAGTRWYCTLRHDAATLPPPYGTRIRLHGRVDDLTGARNPGAVDTSGYAHRHGVAMRLVVRHPRDWCALSGSRVVDLPMRAADAARTNLARNLRSLLPEPRSSLVISAVLGNRSFLPPSIADDFAVTGTTHLLAASGANVLLVWLAVDWVLCHARMPRRGALILGICLIWFYSAMAGGGPSVVRAAVMLTAWLCAEILDRQSDGPCAVAAAALICLTIDPADLLDAGFQLSFLVVAGLLATRHTAHPVASRRLGMWRIAKAVANLRRWAQATVIATLMAAPLIAQQFHQFSLVAILANASVTLAIIAITWLTPPIAMLGSIAPAIARPAACMLLSPLAGFVLWTERMLAQSPGASLNVASPGWPSTILACASLFALIASFRMSLGASRPRLVSGRQARAGTALGALAVVCACMQWHHQRALTVTFLDVGQGDAIAIQLPDGAMWLVDTGPEWDDDDAGRRVVLPFLRSMGVNRIAGLVVTHGDSDHSGGANTLIQRIPIDALFCPHPIDADEDLRKLVGEAKATGVRVTPLAAGDSIAIDPSVRADVLSPDPGLISETPNDRSLVLRLVTGAGAILLTGDASQRAEREELARGVELHSAVLKVAHHGSPSASCDDFLRRVQPNLAVISVGRRNPFGHPAPAVIDRLQRCGATIIRTDRDGAVTVRADGHHWLYSTQAD